MSPLGNEDARAQVGTKGGLSQRWRVQAENGARMVHPNAESVIIIESKAEELDAAKLRIEEAVKALYGQFTANGPRVPLEAVLKIIREIL